MKMVKNQISCEPRRVIIEISTETQCFCVTWVCDCCIIMTVCDLNESCLSLYFLEVNTWICLCSPKILYLLKLLFSLYVYYYSHEMYFKEYILVACQVGFRSGGRNWKLRDRPESVYWGVCYHGKEFKWIYCL